MRATSALLKNVPVCVDGPALELVLELNHRGRAVPAHIRNDGSAKASLPSGEGEALPSAPAVASASASYLC